jgi:hypothetical protein
MTETTTTAAKRARKGSVILTDRMCEKLITERGKIYDKKCSGLYVSITTAGVATFSFKFTDQATGKQRTAWLGVYNPETFTVDDARTKVYGLNGKGGDALAETLRERKVEKAVWASHFKRQYNIYPAWGRSNQSVGGNTPT